MPWYLESRSADGWYMMPTFFFQTKQFYNIWWEIAGPRLTYSILINVEPKNIWKQNVNRICFLRSLHFQNKHVDKKTKPWKKKKTSLLRKSSVEFKCIRWVNTLNKHTFAFSDMQTFYSLVNYVNMPKLVPIDWPTDCKILLSQESLILKFCWLQWCPCLSAW